MTAAKGPYGGVHLPSSRQTPYTLWVPEIVFVAVDLPLRDRRRPGMIRRWHCG